MLLRNVVFATSLLVGAAPAIADTPRTQAAVTVTHDAPKPSASDATNYADREQQEPLAGDFQGGDLIVVGASGGVMLVLLCLLLIL